MQQNNGDNWLVTNSAAMLIPAHTTYTDRSHIVHRISYPCTLIVFYRNRVMKDAWQMTAKKGEKNAYKEFGRFWVWPYRIFIHDFESKFESVFLIFFLLLFCLSRVRKDVCWRLRLLKTPEKTLIYKESVCTRRENH